MVTFPNFLSHVCLKYMLQSIICGDQRKWAQNIVSRTQVKSTFFAMVIIGTTSPEGDDVLRIEAWLKKHFKEIFNETPYLT